VFDHLTCDHRVVDRFMPRPVFLSGRDLCRHSRPRPLVDIVVRHVDSVGPISHTARDFDESTLGATYIEQGNILRPAKLRRPVCDKAGCVHRRQRRISTFFANPVICRCVAYLVIQPGRREDEAAATAFKQSEAPRGVDGNREGAGVRGFTDRAGIRGHRHSLGQRRSMPRVATYRPPRAADT